MYIYICIYAVEIIDVIDMVGSHHFDPLPYDIQLTPPYLWEGLTWPKSATAQYG